MKRIVIFLFVLLLTSCANKESREMINTPKEMSPISLYNQNKDVIISVGMNRSEIEELLGEKSHETRELYRSGEEFNVYLSQLYIYYIDDIAVQFYLNDMSFPKVYYTHLGLNLSSRLQEFYNMYDIPKEMETENRIEDISSYRFAISQSEDGFTIQLIPDYTSYRNFRDNAIAHNEESYYLILGLGHKDDDLDIGCIIIGKANLPD